MRKAHTNVMAMILMMMLIIPGTTFADFFVSVNIAPPALPVYVQPAPPAPDYIWTPGYWAYDSFFEDYYWVPGTWVMAPSAGLLWTPGYWYWRDGQYVYSDGYWGHHVGFYGGINYGYGYGGSGFSGGGWRDNVFVNKTVNVTNITNETNITNNTTTNTASFNGGPGGTNAQPTHEEQVVMKEKHIPATAEQKKNVQAARKDPVLRASVNHGKPAIAATAKPGVFKGRGVVTAKKAGDFYYKTKPIKSGVSKGNKAATVSRHGGSTVAKHTAVAPHNKTLFHAKSKPKAKKPIRKMPPPQVVPKSNSGSGD